MARFAATIYSVGMMVLCAGIVFGQDYPNRPIRIVTTPAGGGSDVMARLIAQAISGPLGQSVIVDNRGGNLSAEIVSRAPSDGYTLLAGGDNIWTGTLLQKLPWDPITDFSPVTLALISPSILVVHPSVPANSVRELIALAKSKPGGLNFAIGGPGGSTHMAGELFKSLAGVNIVAVNYKGSGPSIIALVAGEVHMMFANATVASPHLKSGKARGLAVTSATPSALVPGLPTVAASGVPGYEAVGATAILGRANTPGAIINRLNQEIVRFLRTAETKEKFFNSGAETVGSSPEQLAAAIKSDMAKWGKVIKDAGIKAE